MFFSEYNRTHIQGSHQFKLRGSYTDSDLDGLQFDLAMGDYPSVETPPLVVNVSAHLPKATVDEIAKKAQEAVDAANEAIDKIQYRSPDDSAYVSPEPVEQDTTTEKPTEPNLLPLYLITMSLLLVVLLDKLTGR